MPPGETILSGAPRQCPDCKVLLAPRVLRSAAGYYIGTECSCAPYSRDPITLEFERRRKQLCQII